MCGVAYMQFPNVQVTCPHKMTNFETRVKSQQKLQNKFIHRMLVNEEI